MTKLAVEGAVRILWRSFRLGDSSPFVGSETAEPETFGSGPRSLEPFLFPPLRQACTDAALPPRGD
jgi:hypothetical protein